MLFCKYSTFFCNHGSTWYSFILNHRPNLRLANYLWCMNKISNRSCGLVSIVTWLRVVSHEPTYRKSRALVTIDTSRQLWSEARPA